MKSIIRTAAGMTAAIAGLLAAASCNTDRHITGTFSDIADDSLAVHIFKADSNRPVAVDTIVAENGKFSVDFKDTALFMVNILPLQDYQSMMPEPIYVLPGEKVKVSGSISDPVLSGTRIYDGLARFEGFKTMKDEFQALFEKAAQTAESDILGQQALNGESDRLTARRDSIYAEYVKNNPDDLTSGYLTLFMNPEKGLESYNLLSSTVKESALGRHLDDVASYFESAVEKEKNKVNIQPGKPAPEFSLKDLDGKERNLASFKGRYVLLDFWGEWCYWCMKGMPDMKKYYDKYRSKIEFVGINCRDSEETWRETVESEGLDWTNLYNGTSDEILKSYAVEGFPTKVLIDKEGKIIQVFVGESQELYDKLDELF